MQRDYAGMTTDSDCPFEVGGFDFEEGREPEELIACVLYAAPSGSTVVGLGWHNDGGVFTDTPVVAIEPSTAFGDSAARAVAERRIRLLEPGRPFSWWLRLTGTSSA